MLLLPVYREHVTVKGAPFYRDYVTCNHGLQVYEAVPVYHAALVSRRDTEPRIDSQARSPGGLLRPVKFMGCST